jgi:putative spermidine/putrescine transport system substrate-binding protein
VTGLRHEWPTAFGKDYLARRVIRKGVWALPGARSLFNRSFTSLAFALLADGVPAAELYPTDIDRAFRKLDRIKPHIKVWWTPRVRSVRRPPRAEVDLDFCQGSRDARGASKSAAE